MLYSLNGGAKTGIEYVLPGKTEVTIAEGITTVAADAFRGNTKITSISIPSTVTSIGSRAFDACSALTSVTFAEGASGLSIGIYAFRGTKLASVTIPARTTAIGSEAFRNVTTLTSLTLTANSNSNAELDIGSSAFYGTRITELTIPAQVTSIGASAFYNTRITSVTFAPNSRLTSIGASVFQGCSYLTEANLPENLTAISNNLFRSTKIATIALPDGISEIGQNAFTDCGELTSINLPEGLRTIKREAFKNCKKLTAISLPGAVTSIERNAFDGCSALAAFEFGSGSSALTIGNEVFKGTTALQQLLLPSRISSLGTGVFQNSGVVLASLPQGISEIGEYAFSGCENLVEIDVPASVMTVGNYAFANCSALESVQMAMGLEEIGDYAFQGCASLENFTIPTSVITLGTNILSNCGALSDIILSADNNNYTVENGILYNREKTELIIYPSSKTETSFTIPASITSITPGAFAGAPFTSITLPAGFTEIPDSLFDGCVSLASVTVEGAITQIGANAFRGTKLTSFRIPNTVTLIGNGAFDGCSLLATLTFEEGGTKALSIGEYAFRGTALQAVHFPGRLRAQSGPEVNGDLTVYSGIGAYAFANNSSLASVTFGGERPKELVFSSLTVGDGAFENCTALTAIEFPNTLSNFRHGETVNSGWGGPSMQFWIEDALGEYVFKGCTNLASIILPQETGVRVQIGGVLMDATPRISMGEGVFAGLEKLTSFVITGLVTGEYGRGGTLPKNMFTGSVLTQITIPANVGSVNDSVFEDCKELTTVVFEGEDTSLYGKNIFSGCSKLANVTLPSKLETIYESAFKDCTLLATLTIPQTVTLIRAGAFENCTALTALTVPVSVESIQAGVFRGFTEDQTITFAGRAGAPSSWTAGWNDGCEAKIVYENATETDSSENGNA